MKANVKTQDKPKKWKELSYKEREKFFKLASAFHAKCAKHHVEFAKGLKPGSKAQKFHSDVAQYHRALNVQNAFARFSGKPPQ